MGLFQSLPEEAPYACLSSNFYSSAAIVERANSTDSRSLEEHAPLPTSIPAQEHAPLPTSTSAGAGRGWKRRVLFQTLLEEAGRAQSYAPQVTIYLDQSLSKQK